MTSALKNVLFFNCLHNGDVLLGREFVRQLAQGLNAKQTLYAHGNSPKLLADLSSIIQVPLEEVGMQLHLYIPLTVRITEESVAINCWIGANQKVALKPHTMEKGLDVDTYRRYFSSIAQELKAHGLLPPHFNFSPQTKDLIPAVDWRYFDLASIKSFFTKKQRLRVLIVNSPVQSGQAENFAFEPVVVRLAARFPRVDFFLTNRLEPSLVSLAPAVRYTDEIIGPREGGDLMENAFFSTYCDLLVGRSSGVFCAAVVRENYLNPCKTLICFSAQNEIWAKDVPARTIWSNDQTIENVEKVIADEIRLKEEAA